MNQEVYNRVRELSKSDFGAAFTLFVAAFYQFVLCQVKRKIWTDQEDVTQDVFQGALDGFGCMLERTKNPSGARAWLCAITRNKIIDWLRKQKRQPKRDANYDLEALLVEDADLAEKLDGTSLPADVSHALEDLQRERPDLYAVLDLKHVMGRSQYQPGGSRD